MVAAWLLFEDGLSLSGECRPTNIALSVGGGQVYLCPCPAREGIYTRGLLESQYLNQNDTSSVKSLDTGVNQWRSHLWMER